MGARQSSTRDPLLQNDSRDDEEQGPRSSLTRDGSSAADAPSFDKSVKISIRDLSRVAKDGTVILNSVNIEVRAGQITALIGPSGSGKSTVLRSLNRLWEPSPGSVLLDGADITQLNVVGLRRRVGMLFQSAALFEGTVADNIRYGPSLAGKTLTNSEVNDCLQSADLSPSFSSKDVSTLSGGQAQRVALARTLANHPEVLLLDEPTSALDPAATLAVEQTVRKLVKGSNHSVVWVSHSVEQVLRVAHVAVLLVDGKVEDEYSPAELGDGSHPLAERFASGLLRSSKSIDRRPSVGQ